MNKKIQKMSVPMKRLRSVVVITVSLLIATCFLFFFPSQNKEESKEHKTVQSSEEWQHAFLQKISANTPPRWMLDQIDADLAAFPKIDAATFDKVMDEWKAQGQFVRYRIIDKKLLIGDTSHIFDASRLKRLTKSLNILVKTIALPNVDFIVSLHDSIDSLHLDTPIFAFAKNVNSHQVILLPDFEVLSEISRRFLREVEKGIKKYPWSKKTALGFWRGATTGAEISSENDFSQLPRFQAVRASLQQPALIDAKFHQLVQCTDPKEIRHKFSAYFVKSMTRVKDHLKYKYQLLIDGNTCAYSRAYWQLFSNCAILKQESPNIQWYYRILSPYVHYIPLQHDLSDLPEKIQWAKEHDAEVTQIVANAQALAQENLKQSDCYYYLYLLLKAYAGKVSIGS